MCVTLLFLNIMLPKCIVVAVFDKRMQNYQTKIKACRAFFCNAITQLARTFLVFGKLCNDLFYVTKSPRFFICGDAVRRAVTTERFNHFSSLEVQYPSLLEVTRDLKTF